MELTVLHLSDSVQAQWPREKEIPCELRKPGALLDRKKLPFFQDPMRLLSSTCKNEIEKVIPWLPFPYVFKDCKTTDGVLEIELGNEFEVSCGTILLSRDSRPVRSLSIPLRCQTSAVRLKKRMEELGVHSLKFLRDDFETPSAVCFSDLSEKDGKAKECGCLEYDRVTKYLMKGENRTKGVSTSKVSYDRFKPLSCITATELAELNHKFPGVPKTYQRLIEKLNLLPEASPVFVRKKPSYTETQIQYLSEEGEMTKRIFHSFHNTTESDSGPGGAWVEVPDLSLLPPEPKDSPKDPPEDPKVKKHSEPSSSPMLKSVPETVDELKTALADFRLELDKLMQMYSQTQSPGTVEEGLLQMDRIFNTFRYNSDVDRLLTMADQQEVFEELVQQYGLLRSQAFKPPDDDSELFHVFNAINESGVEGSSDPGLLALLRKGDELFRKHFNETGLREHCFNLLVHRKQKGGVSSDISRDYIRFCPNRAPQLGWE